MRSKISTDELFAQAQLGMGATKHVGSDSYGYYISFIDPEHKTIGLYEPDHWFEHSWTDGSMKHAAYVPDTPPTLYLQAWRGKWYVLDSLGNRTGSMSIHLGACCFYQDPSL